MWQKFDLISAVVHGGCPDGMASAFAILLAFPKAVIIQHRHNRPMPHIRTAKVIFADIVPSRAELVATIKRLGPENVRVFDHHLTAKEALQGLPNCVFDMNRSAAVITWEELHPDRPLPLIFKYVQDRDLWTWLMKHSREVNAWLGSWNHFQDMTVWESLAEQIENDLPSVIEQGAAILRVQTQMVERLCSTARFSKFAGYQNVAVVNSALMPSEVGHRLLELHQIAPFAVIYNKTADQTHYELRSRDGGVNVANIAKRLGGGGHPAAAGFTKQT